MIKSCLNLFSQYMLLDEYSELFTFFIAVKNFFYTFSKKMNILSWTYVFARDLVVLVVPSM